MPQHLPNTSSEQYGDNIIIGDIKDESLAPLPTYQDLYHRWERQQWSALDIDFYVDRAHWAEIPLKSRASLMDGLVIFFQGEVSVANTLLPYHIAMPKDEQRVFIATQLADEVRHAIFLNRFFKEVLLMEGPDMESLLMQVRPLLDAAPREILIDGLEEISQKIHDEPKKLPYLVEGVTLYHILVEATLGLSAQRTVLTRVRRSGLYPGFQQGFMSTCRDESRHVLFGVKFLREMVVEYPEYAEVIRATITRWMPQVRAILSTTGFQRAFIETAGEDPDEALSFGMNSLRKKLKVIGVAMDLH